MNPHRNTMPCILFLLRYFIWKRFVVVVDFLFGLFIHSFVWSVNWVWKSTKYSLAVIFVCNVVVIVHFRLYFCTLAFFASAHALFFAFIRIYVICCILSRYYPLWIFFSSSLHVRKRARPIFSWSVFFLASSYSVSLSSFYWSAITSCRDNAFASRSCELKWWWKKNTKFGACSFG